jgi:hypothetical protein
MNKIFFALAGHTSIQLQTKMRDVQKTTVLLSPNGSARRTVEKAAHYLPAKLLTRGDRASPHPFQPIVTVHITRSNALIDGGHVLPSPVPQVFAKLRIERASLEA